MRTIVAASTRAEDAAPNFTHRAYPHDRCGQLRSAGEEQAEAAGGDAQSRSRSSLLSVDLRNGQTEDSGARVLAHLPALLPCRGASAARCEDREHCLVARDGEVCSDRVVPGRVEV